MKKLMLLGGSAQQVIAIDTARRLGFETILCDYLPDNPGRLHADRFYLVSTTDKAAVLQVAREEHIDGIVAYASDPAAPTAAFVAERLGLPGNPAASVETLCNKDLFRAFLRDNGFHTPQAAGHTAPAQALEDLNRFSFPVIIKPVDSSGSKGATVLRTPDGAREAIDFAFSFSRSKRIVLEEFIEKSHPYLIGGDVFIVDGKIVLWGLMNCHRDQNVNPLVPVGKSYPPALEDKALRAVQNTLQSMVDCLGLHSGAMNVELILDGQGRVFPIDVGPRNGGNMIPDLLGLIFGTDVVEATILAAMGLPPRLSGNAPIPFYATHNLHSDRDGIYQDIRFSRELEPYILRKCIYKAPGDPVEYFDNAAKALGILFLKFPDQDTMHEILSQIHRHIEIILKD